ncbi:hypothetical protein BKA69DRAFT_1092385 [Paraphysoderma sedebokerense]|nr:hypothetical protein BKA69DRAFT_1092385 [Paraphysoderma sedebokerense]
MRPHRFRMSLRRFWPSVVMTRALGVALVVFLVGTGLGLGCLFLLQTAEKVILRKELTNECLFRGTVLENSLNSSIVQLASFYSAFVKSKINLNQSNFSNFNQLVDLNSVPVFGVGWSVEITPSQIDEWENRYSQKVKAIDGQFNGLPVERNRSSYLPITFIHPYETSKFMIGRGEAATRALRTGQPTISDIIPLPESHGDGFVLFYPVSNYTFDGGSTKRGILSFAFEVGKVIDSDLKDMLSSKIKLVVHEGGHDSLQPDNIIWQHMRNGVKYIEALQFDVKLAVVDRTWDLDCIPSADFVKTYVSWIPYAAFAAIQIVFAVLAVMVYRWIAMLHRTRKVASFTGKTNDLRSILTISFLLTESCRTSYKTSRINGRVRIAG